MGRNTIHKSENSLYTCAMYRKIAKIINRMSWYKFLCRPLGLNSMWGMSVWNQGDSCVLFNSLRPSDTYMRRQTIIASDNGLSPGWCQAIIWTNAWMLIGPLETNFSEILIAIRTSSLKKKRLKMSSKWRPFCLCLNVLKIQVILMVIVSKMQSIPTAQPWETHMWFSMLGLKLFGVKSKMKMWLEQRRQAMLQLHLSDHKFYCLLRYTLYWRFDGIYNPCEFLLW